MGTRTEKINKPETITIPTCDICGKDIVIDDDDYVTHCDMCQRDIHSDGKHDCGGHDPENGDMPLCKICLELGKEHWALVDRQAEERDESYERWSEKCQEHMYDDR